MLRKNGFVSMLVVLVLFGGFVPAEAQRGSITPLPEARDPRVWDGPVDVRYSREWFSAKHRQFRQAKEDGDTATVVALVQEMAGGWLYNANAAHHVVTKGISYLRGLGEENHVEDLIALKRARAEVVQYMPTGDSQQSRDFLWGKIVCTDYEIAQVYSRSGDHVSALRALERYYSEQREQRMRLSAAPHPVHAACPLDEEKTLSELLEAYCVVAVDTAIDPATARGYMEAAERHGETLRALVGPEKTFRWANQTVAEAYGNSVWSIDSLLLFLARTLGTAPGPYVALVAALAEENTEHDRFTYGDALAGKEYLVEQKANQRTIAALYDTYRTVFLTWPEGEDGFEYQGISLHYLSFALEHGLFDAAEEIIAHLDGLRFANPAHSGQFTILRSAFRQAR